MVGEAAAGGLATPLQSPEGSAGGVLEQLAGRAVQGGAQPFNHPCVQASHAPARPSQPVGGRDVHARQLGKLVGGHAPLAQELPNSEPHHAPEGRHWLRLTLLAPDATMGSPQNTEDWP